MSLRAKCAIAGLGQTRMGKNFDHPGPIGFAAEAVNLALEDAGLQRSDLDGLLVNPGITWFNNPMAFDVAAERDGHPRPAPDRDDEPRRRDRGRDDHACRAGYRRRHGRSRRMRIRRRSAASALAEQGRAMRARPRRTALPRVSNAHYGQYGVNAQYAFVAQRHMYKYGTTSDHLGAVAVSERDWANLNPVAQFHDAPMTLADYHASRWVVEPFHLYDCCLVSNGGLAVIVTSAERAKTLKRPPVYILGMGQGHPGGDPLETLVSGAPIAKETAFKMAGIKLGDVNFCELYDCYTFTVLVTLEDYGFCKKGEGGPFVASGAIAPGGALPVNTGGGQLSSFYMWGMTPVAEAIVQMRGDGGRRQVPKHDVGLVSGNGGILATHSTLVLGSQP